MRLQEFKKAGHWPTLLAAFLYFDISFMAWVSLGPLMIYIAKGMNLPVEDKLSLVAIPVLAGAFFRVPLGLIADAIGSKVAGVGAQIVVIFAVTLVFVFGLPAPAAVAMFGIVLGVGGASFAVALPQASRWYPPHYQGIVMGIAGAGNMGVVLDTLLAPLDRRNIWLEGRLWRAAPADVGYPPVLRVRGQGSARRPREDRILPIMAKCSSTPTAAGSCSFISSLSAALSGSLRRCRFTSRRNITRRASRRVSWCR